MIANPVIHKGTGRFRTLARCCCSVYVYAYVRVCACAYSDTPAHFRQAQVTVGFQPRQRLCFAPTPPARSMDNLQDSGVKPPSRACVPGTMLSKKYDDNSQFGRFPETEREGCSCSWCTLLLLLMLASCLHMCLCIYACVHACICVCVWVC